MSKDDIDKLWNQAMNEAVKNGEDFTRHRFAALAAAAEREACAKVCEAKRIVKGGEVFAAAIRARGENT